MEDVTSVLRAGEKVGNQASRGWDEERETLSGMGP